MATPCTQAQAEMTLHFRAAFIAPCSGDGHRWYIFHKPSLRRTEKVNIEPLLLPKKCVQVSSSSSGHANNLDVRGNRSFDVGNKTTRGRTVYPLCVCGWFPERLMNFKWAGQRVKSHTDVENWVLSGHIFCDHIPMWEAPEPIRPRNGQRGPGAVCLVFIRTNSGFELVLFVLRIMIHNSYVEGTKLTTSLMQSNQYFWKCNAQYPTFPRVSPYDPMFPRAQCCPSSRSQSPTFQSPMF